MAFCLTHPSIAHRSSCSMRLLPSVRSFANSLRLRATSARTCTSKAKPIAPYEFGGAPHHHHYDHAYLFGIEPGTPRESWATITYAIWGVSLVLLVFGVGFKSDNSLESWAKNEAAARAKIIEAGGSVEYGKTYQAMLYRWTIDEADKTPRSLSMEEVLEESGASASDESEEEEEE